jgi:predicted P-loop ATPase
MNAPFDAGAIAADAVRQAEADRSSSPDWRRGLIVDDRGGPLPILANAAHALRTATELAGMVTFDEMARQAQVTRVLPDSKMEAVIDKRALTDQDAAAVQEWLQQNGIRRIGREVTHQAVDMVAHENSFHPLRNFLNGLQWDKQPRLDTWLSRYVGSEAEQTEDLEQAEKNVTTHRKYTATIGRMFLIGMVARIMRPGCKCDYMLILEGPQGARKSTVCAILGGPWFSDNLQDVTSDSVRASMHLRGKWLIEMAELSAVSKAETEALKAFLTQTEERYTPKYGRNEVVEARQCVFIGTTNQTTYLRDESGGRRFWPVTVGEIDTDALIRDRDQLFAEAVASFNSGEKWWPDGEFERELIAPQQERRFVIDEWENLISTWIDGALDQEGKRLPPRRRCTVKEAAEGALLLDPAHLGTREQRRITAALRRLGWRTGRDESGRWWELPSQ